MARVPGLTVLASSTTHFSAFGPTWRVPVDLGILRGPLTKLATGLPWRAVEIRLFGHMEVLRRGEPVEVRGAKQRTLIALLALQRGSPVSGDRLADALWAEDPPGNPANALQAQISQLRRILGPGPWG